MSKLVVLVDDNHDDEMLTTRAFDKSGMDVELVVLHDGDEATEYFFGKWRSESVASLCSLILLDVKLPKVDGVELLKRLRKEEQSLSVPIVMLSTSNDEKTVLSCYRNGANSYIRKPVDFNEFSKAIMKLGDYWLTLNYVV